MATIPDAVKEVCRKTPLPERRSAHVDRRSPVAALVQRHDRDRFQTVLFAPAARREALFALYAFNYEIARVRESVRQPLLGQIRLQWWRENIAAAFAGDPIRPHVVVEPLTRTIRERALTRAHFDRLIDARESDLGDDPPATLAILEDYAEATSARLIYLALEILEVRDAAAHAGARHIGIAYALAGLLRAMPFRVRTGRQPIPVEIAARTGLADQDYQVLSGTPSLRAATAELAATASRHLAAADALRSYIPPPAIPGLLPAVITRRSLARLKRAGYNPFDPSVAGPDPLQSWRLAIAAFLHRL